VPIRNVSDTARWVAVYRADESRRRDALFRDPWADRLAGERGREIVATVPGGRSWGWPMVVRTKVMDDLIEREVAAGVDTVLSLAAGLDMRPYRLDLPASLRWVEIDLPGILAEKESAIAGETPRCTVERLDADLGDEAARREAFGRVGGANRRVLVVAEGLLIYLEPRQVAALAGDLAAMPGARSWLIDLASTRLLDWLAKRWGKVTAAGGAPFKFAPAEGTAFFAPHGWREREFHGALEEAWRLKRAPAYTVLWKWMSAMMPAAKRERWRRFSGYALLDRAG
jgi:methyltransferase (TIGR00027 family)